MIEGAAGKNDSAYSGTYIPTKVDVRVIQWTGSRVLGFTGIYSSGPCTSPWSTLGEPL